MHASETKQHGNIVWKVKGLEKKAKTVARE